MTNKPKLPNIPGCRNPHDGENPLKTMLRLLNKKNKKQKARTAQEILKDKVVY